MNIWEGAQDFAPLRVSPQPLLPISPSWLSLKAKMLFKNPSVNVEDLPNASQASYTPLHNDYIMVQLFNAIVLYVSIFAVVAFVALVVIDAFWTHPFLYAMLMVMMMLSLLGLQVYFVVAGFKYKGYCIRQHDVLYRSGLIFKRELAVPLRRIQHVEVKRGIFSRIFELASLHIYTAGSGSVDLKIPGISLADAEKLMEHLSQTISHER